MSASHGSDTKVSIFTRMIDHFLVLAIIIALLTRLSGFQMFTDNANLIFGVLDNVRTNECTFPSFCPIQRGSTLTSIKNFKGGHLQTSLIAIVVREFSKWKRFLPFLAEGDDTSSKYIFKHLVNSFNLALRLRVISSTEFQMSAHSFLETIPELGGENAAMI